MESNKKRRIEKKRRVKKSPDFAAANAAATTRLSVGYKEVSRNFTPEK